MATCPWCTPSLAPSHNIRIRNMGISGNTVRARPQLKGVVLMTPYFIEPNRAEPMRAKMDRYGEIVLRLAKKYETVAVDTQAAFDAILIECHPMTLASDRAHPTLAGHMILARAFLNALEYTW